MSGFRNPVLEKIRELEFGLGFFEFLNAEKIPGICRKNWAILSKLQDSANSNPIFHSWQKKQNSLPKKSYNLAPAPTWW
jgi:hypothetical protein